MPGIRLRLPWRPDPALTRSPMRTQPWTPEQQAVIDDVVGSANTSVNRHVVNEVNIVAPDEYLNAKNWGGYYDHPQGVLASRSTYSGDELRSVMAHELQHTDQRLNRPDDPQYWDAVDPNEDQSRYDSLQAEIESRAAEWAEMRRVKNPLLWEREALAQALAHPDWEAGPKSLAKPWNRRRGLNEERAWLRTKPEAPPPPPPSRKQRKLPFEPLDRALLGGERMLRRSGKALDRALHFGERWGEPW